MGPTGDEILNVSREHGLVCKPMYLIRTTVTSGMGPVLEIMPEHLQYWADMEEKHVLFAAGPVMPEDSSEAWSGEGMVIIRAESLEEAKRIADADPMHKSGARTYALQPWLLNHLVPD
jgi:uncharacterized protein YciI